MFHASSAIATVKITGQASVTFLPLWNHFTCWSVNETLCENFTLQRLDSYLASVTVASNRLSKSRRENDFFFSVSTLLMNRSDIARFVKIHVQ